MATPKTLNGFPVIESKNHNNGYVTVMVEKPGEWVIATWWPELKTQWSWGHYETQYKDALETFRRVRDRNENRGRV